MIAKVGKLERKLRRWLDKVFDGRPSGAIATFAVGLIAVIGVFDYVTGHELIASVFYLLPISLAAWYGSRRTGLALALFSAVVLYLANSEQVYAHPLIGYWNAAMHLLVFAFTTLLLSRLRAELAQARELGRTDPLTAVANRRAFYDQVTQEIRRMVRNPRTLTLAYLDLDNFKEVNDLLGHVAGDQLLVEAAQCIKAHIRQTDLVARLGGDEFAIFLPETGSAGAATLLVKINEALLQTMIDHNWPVTCSVGVVTYETPPPSVDSIIQRADALMYQVKRGGKNQIRYEVIGTEPAPITS